MKHSCMTTKKQKLPRIVLIILACVLIQSVLSPNGGIIHSIITITLSIFQPDVYRFPHFLPQMKNPCYLFENEHELFDPLSNKNTERRRPSERLSRVTLNENGQNNTHVLRCLPYYYVLGWPKCGTSDLYAKMMVHPLILKPPTKEPMFFNDRRYSKRLIHNDHTLQDFLDFTDSSPTRILAKKLMVNQTWQVGHIFGDHSTHTIDMWTGYNTEWQLKYSFDAYPEPTDVPLVYTLSNAQLIKRLTPDARLIIVLRDPVERFYSLYKMHEATSPQDFHNGAVNGINWWNACIEQNIPIGECMYARPKVQNFEPIDCTWLSRAVFSTHRSIYHLYVEEWIKVFPLDQFLILKFEDYASEEIETINEKVFPFLGLEKLTSGRLEVMKKVKRQKVISMLKNSAGKRINHKYKLPMLNKTRTLLREFYRPYNVKLAALLKDDRFLWDY